MGVFNCDDGVGCKITDFEVSAGVLSGLFVCFGPWGLYEDAAIEPLLYGFVVLAVMQASAGS